MYAQVSAVAAAPTQNAMTEINPRSANFHPSVWGDRFLTYSSEYLVKMHRLVHLLSCPFECLHVYAHVK
jgi:hypothetical protein